MDKSQPMSELRSDSHHSRDDNSEHAKDDQYNIAPARYNVCLNTIHGVLKL